MIKRDIVYKNIEYGKKVKGMEFFLLAGGFVIILIPVVISVVSSVVSGIAAAVEDEED